MAGNILSALVWLRPSVIRKNSSAIYLGSLAINDAVYLLVGLVMSLWPWLLPQFQQPRYFVLVTDVITATARRLEPLLVLAFSVERLIAVRFPFHVRNIASPLKSHSYNKPYVTYDAIAIQLRRVRCQNRSKVRAGNINLLNN